jgi:hypothetical protein
MIRKILDNTPYHSLNILFNILAPLARLLKKPTAAVIRTQLQRNNNDNYNNNQNEHDNNMPGLHFLRQWDGRMR